MAVEPLKLPSDALATDKFPKKYISPTRLVRISAYHTGEPYFGKSGNNRFDAPGAVTGTPEFGVCYFGTSLDLAMAESILHDEIPVNGAFTITRAQIDGRFALYFGGKPLHLLDLTGPLLKRLGGNADLAGTTDYGFTQQRARAVHDNPAGYDGFLYMSRHLNTKRAVALFDRTPSAHFRARKWRPLMLKSTEKRGIMTHAERRKENNESARQQFLLLPALQEWLPEGHLAYFINDTVDLRNDKRNPQY